MRAIFAGGIAAILLVVSGCSGASGRTINGTWDVTGGDTPPDSTISMTMDAPDKMTMNMVMKQGEGKVTAVATGTYKLEGEKFDISFDKANLSFSGYPEAMQKVMESQKAAAEKSFLETMGGTHKNTIKWVDDKTVEMTSEGKTNTLKKR